MAAEVTVVADNEDASAPPPLEVLAELHRQIDEVVKADDWERLEPLLAARDALLAGIDGADRRPALESARALTERILRRATDARLDVADRLAELRRARKATDVYRAHR